MNKRYGDPHPSVRKSLVTGPSSTFLALMSEYTSGRCFRDFDDESELERRRTYHPSVRKPLLETESVFGIASMAIQDGTGRIVVRRMPMDRTCRDEFFLRARRHHRTENKESAIRLRHNGFLTHRTLRVRLSLNGLHEPGPTLPSHPHRVPALERSRQGTRVSAISA